MAERKCKLNELVVLRTTLPNSRMHGLFGTTVAFMGSGVFNCCPVWHDDVWMVELQNPIRIPGIGDIPHVGIQDRDLFPIRPGPDPESVDTNVPAEGVTA